MKRIIIALMLVLLMLTGCGQNVVSNAGDRNEEVVTKEETPKHVVIKQSEDKHIAYMKNYVGKNLASVGYTSLGGNRNDYIGEDIMTLWLQTPDGSYIDIEDDEILKEYVVVAQQYEPNTEIRFGFDTDSEGNEYSWPNWCSIKNMTLQVRKIKDTAEFDHNPEIVKLADDKYTYYVPDFKGLNLAQFGYVSLGGDKRVYIGEDNIKLNVVSDDGSYVDIEDDDAITKYVVVDQNIEPNTPIKFEYDTYSDGEERSYPSRCSISEIDIYVKYIG